MTVPRKRTTTPDPRIRRTERAVLAAARRLFERQGYAATTMTQIAAEAACAERTLFLRFRSKAELLKFVVDQTFRGDPSVEGPPAWLIRARTAPNLDARLRAFADGTAEILDRIGPLFAVAREAEASEPFIADAFNAARRDTQANIRRMWQGLAHAGQLHPDVDIDWVADTTGLLAGADTYLLMKATLGWSRNEYASWLHRTWLHFATTPS